MNLSSCASISVNIKCDQIIIFACELSVYKSLLPYSMKFGFERGEMQSLGSLATYVTAWQILNHQFPSYQHAKEIFLSIVWYNMKIVTL